MSKELDEAVRNLSDFLLQHPELMEYQFALMKEMDKLEPEDRLNFLMNKIGTNLKLMNEKQREVAVLSEKLNKDLKELNK